MIISLICPRHGYQKGDSCSRCEQEPVEVFNTPKDKLFEFVDINTTGKPVEIRSKGQWKRFMKEHNITDDRTQKAYRLEDLESKMNKCHKKQMENFKSEITPLVKEAMREKHKWMSKEKFYRRANG